jgi:hypothetical protein
LAASFALVGSGGGIIKFLPPMIPEIIGELAPIGDLLAGAI